MGVMAQNKVVSFYRPPCTLINSLHEIVFNMVNIDLSDFVNIQSSNHHQCQTYTV